MNPNQYVYEVARDLITMMKELPEGQTLTVEVKRHSGICLHMYDWHTNRGECCGRSEAAVSIGKAYEGG